MRPNGPGTEGQPVLIQENNDGSAHVIGGAGGKLNFLKLRSVRSESDYKQEVEQRRKQRAEQRKEQRKKDKEAGILESKKKAREQVKMQQYEHEKEFVQTVASTLGWSPESIEFPEADYADLSEAALNKVRNKHHRDLMRRASDAIDLQRQRLVTDATMRMESDIGEIPIDSDDPDVLSAQDLNPIPENTGGLGFSADYKGRAEEAGLTEEDLQKEVAKTKEDNSKHLTDAQRQAAVRRGATAKLIKDEIENIRDPVLPDATEALADAKQAIELIKAQKKLRQLQRKAREATSEIDKSATEPKAYLIEYTAEPDEDAKIIEELNNDLRVIQTKAFLSEFNRLAGPNPEDTLGKYLGVGAYNSINSLALAVGGDALVDRSVVDVLGIAGAAEVLARRIHTDLAEDVDHIAAGVQEFHLHNYMETSEEALNQARDLMDAAREIEIGEAASGADLQTAQELNARRREAIFSAQKIVGQALGEMEANAALVVSLKRGKKDSFQVSLGKTSIESAIQQVRAIGLQRGDYKIETVAGDTFLTITGDGMDRLAKPVNREDIEQIQRNMDIINGRYDDDDWLPMGVANRADLSMEVQPGVAPRLAEPFEPGKDLEQSLMDYIGGRTADGDPPADIIADIQSADFFMKVGDERNREYRAALDAVAPLKDDKGKLRRAEALADTFDGYADQFVQNRYGGERSTLNRQNFEVDQKSVDALHRALSETPEGVAAYKQLGDLTNRDQRALREYFYRHVAKESPEAAELRERLEKLEEGGPPEKETTDMFGETVTNPEWSHWQQRRNDLAAEVNAASLTWVKYTDALRGRERAYEAIQDLIRSRVEKTFVDVFNKLNPEHPLKMGRTVIRNNLNHLDATDPAAAEERARREREMIDSLRNRIAGRYAHGSVVDKLDAARERREAFDQAQMGFFSSEELQSEAPEEAPLAGDERYTLGHVAERRIAGMMGIVGKNFRPGQPLRLWNPTMAGGKNYPRQRLVRMVEANKRVVAAFGTGSGKSLLQLAAFTHLHEKGEAKRGLFLVPSIVQGQFSGEALRYLEPGKYNWHIEPGASREERIKAYKDPENHFAIMTHQSFRDDMVHLGAKHAGISESEMSNRVNAMNDGERKEWMKNILNKEDIKFDYLTIDESQYTVNRAGKENSLLANVIDSFSHTTPYYLAASADPVKNDASEVFDMMRKMDPERYTDRAAFMRRYGTDTLASKESLRREMARYVYPSRIDPDVKAHKTELKINLSEGQRTALDELEKNFANARIARMQGRVDIDAVRAISPTSFDGVPEDRHEDIARDLQQSLGILKSSSIQRVINTHPDNPNIDKLIEVANERKGRPGVVFAHSLEAVKNIADRLGKAGHRVVTITGGDSSKEKDRKRGLFHPEQGEAEADILVASDAGATGVNLQRGKWMYQFDVPQTAMVHAQRNGRIFRTGQKEDVELMDGLVDHPEVHRARERLMRKYGLRELMTSPFEGLDDTGVAHYINQQRIRAQDSQGGLI